MSSAFDRNYCASPDMGEVSADHLSGDTEYTQDEMVKGTKGEKSGAKMI